MHACIKVPDRDGSRHLQSSLHHWDVVIEDASASSGREDRTSTWKEK
jgi:hypothetical protein